VRGFVRRVVERLKRVRKRTWFLVFWLVATVPLWLPAVTLATSGKTDVYQYYVKTLEYGLKGLGEYLDFLLEMFKLVMGG